MLTLVDIIVIFAIAVVAVPALLFFAECLLALLPRRAMNIDGVPRPRIAIVIPAHDEEVLIDATVRSIRAQLRDGDELIVVADNCTDETADRAAKAGATVAVRTDATLRGKGYALGFGMDHLQANPPEVVIFFDADCAIDAGVVDRIALEARRSGRPVQAAYVLAAEFGASPINVVSSLAFTVKNIVRPRGLARLGNPCPLTGTGMAFPWAVISGVALASGEIVEDMQIGIDLLREGHGPLFCDAVLIRGHLPSDRDAALGQRTRWEHGHLGMIRRGVLPLLAAGVRKGRPSLVICALDYAIPPLAFLVILCVAAIAVSTTGALVTGHWILSWISASVLGSVLCGVLIGWAGFARHLPLASLLSIPKYILWKMPLYAKFFSGPQTAWVRTARAQMSPNTAASQSIEAK